MIKKTKTTHRLFPAKAPWLTALMALLVSWVSASSATAQRTVPNAPSPATASAARELLNRAYPKTKTAKTLDDFSEIINICRQALAAGPSKTDDQYLRRLLGWASNRRGEAYADQAMAAASKGATELAAQLEALALTDFEAAVKHDPRAWKAIHNRGVSYAQLGRYDDAIAQFDRVIKLKADYANAWFDRAELHYELGRFEKAVSDYTAALRLKPEDEDIYISRGHAYFQLGQFELSLADYARAVAFDTENAEPYVHRGDAYQSLGKWQEAAADFRRAIDLNDNLGHAYQSAAWLMATCPDRRFRDATLATQAAQKAIELDGESPLYLQSLAAAYANAGRFDQATETLKKVIEMAGENADEDLKKRLLLYQQKKPYRQVERTEPKTP